MNYFPFYADPVLSAQCLDDKRLPRIFSETVMTLSRLQFEMTGIEGPYSSRMPIPLALLNWLRGTTARHWFVAWAAAVRDECIYRFGEERVRSYLCERKRKELFPYLCNDAPPASVAFLNMARSTDKGLDFTHMPDVHEAYRAYIAHQWTYVDKRAPAWSGRPAPDFYVATISA